jgi:hypothetical protein
VQRRSARRGDSPEAQKAAEHRGLLFASGLVAGEAIMGILYAVLLATKLAKRDQPWVMWVDPTGMVDFISLGALAAMTWLLIHKSLGSVAPRNGKQENTGRQ